MKKIYLHIKIAILNLICILFYSSCSPVVKTQKDIYYSPNNSTIPVRVYNLDDHWPSTYESIGEVKIRDSGLSVYNLEDIAKCLEIECKKMGGNAVKITAIYPPDWSSTVYRYDAKILLIPSIGVEEEQTGYNEALLKKYWSDNGIVEMEGIYEIIGGNHGNCKIGLKKISDDEYYFIYLSGNTPYPNLWKEGDLKAKLSRTANDNLYKVIWYFSDKNSGEDMYASFTDQNLKILSPIKSHLQFFCIKQYPTSKTKSYSLSGKANVRVTGTGFAINHKGYVITNHHVIDGANKIRIRGINSNFIEAYEAIVIATDKNNDISLLKINDQKFHGTVKLPYAIKLEGAAVGERVFTLGYPLISSMGQEIKVTDGIISSRSGFQGDITCYQISVPIHPGNSGSPLFDTHGNIIGIITSKLTKTENVSYAVKMLYIKGLLDAVPECDISIASEGLDKESLDKQIELIKRSIYLIECE